MRAHFLRETEPRMFIWDLTTRFAESSVSAFARIVIGILVWHEGDEAVGGQLMQQVALGGTARGELLVGQPEAIQDEIVRINTEAGPIALQVALLIPISAGLIGLINGFRMRRVPDPKATGERVTG